MDNQEYEKKRNQILSERDEIIKDLEVKLERGYYQTLEQCKENLSKDPQKKVLEEKMKQRKKLDNERIKAGKSADTSDHQRYVEIESLSNELKVKHGCNVTPFDIIDAEIGGVVGKNAYESRIHNDLEFIKKKQVRPIVQKYIKQLNELEQQSSKKESKTKFVPVHPQNW